MVLRQPAPSQGGGILAREPSDSGKTPELAGLYEGTFLRGAWSLRSSAAPLLVGKPLVNLSSGPQAPGPFPDRTGEHSWRPQLRRFLRLGGPATGEGERRGSPCYPGG